MKIVDESKQNIVSSLTSVLASIENDRQAYRWFLILITLRKVRQDLCCPKQGEASQRHNYKTLKKIQLTEIFVYGIIVLIGIVSWLIKQPGVFLLEAIPWVLLVRIFKHNRQCVAAISKELLLKNIPPQELDRQTLFQMCEYFSKKHNIPSLVDIIAFQDSFSRKGLLAIILFLPFSCFFSTLNVLQLLAVNVAVFILIQAFVNASIVLRRLK